MSVVASRIPVSNDCGYYRRLRYYCCYQIFELWSICRLRGGAVECRAWQRDRLRPRQFGKSTSINKDREKKRKNEGDGEHAGPKEWEPRRVCGGKSTSEWTKGRWAVLLKRHQERKERTLSTKSQKRAISTTDSKKEADYKRENVGSGWTYTSSEPSCRLASNRRQVQHGCGQSSLSRVWPCAATLWQS